MENEGLFPISFYLPSVAFLSLSYPASLISSKVRKVRPTHL